MERMSNLAVMQELLDTHHIGHDEIDDGDKLVVRIESPMSAYVDIGLPSKSAYASAPMSSEPVNSVSFVSQRDFMPHFNELRSFMEWQDDESIGNAILYNYDRIDEAELLRILDDNESAPDIGLYVRRSSFVQQMFENRDVNLDFMMALVNANMRFFHDVLSMVTAPVRDDAGPVDLNAFKRVLMESLPSF